MKSTPSRSEIAQQRRLYDNDRFLKHQNYLLQPFACVRSVSRSRVLARRRLKLASGRLPMLPSLFLCLSAVAYGLSHRVVLTLRIDVDLLSMAVSRKHFKTWEALRRLQGPVDSEEAEVGTLAHIPCTGGRSVVRSSESVELSFFSGFSFLST